jgi:hypothetical protein
MKNLIRNTIVILACGIVSGAYGGLPAMNVTVADSSGKTTFKGATNSKGGFSTGVLKPGNYAVQSTASNVPQGTRYTLVVSAGKKKVMANAIGADRFNQGGVAMKIDVGAGLNITGQVAAEDKNSAPLGKNGKPMVWIPKKLGSNIAPHWADADSAEAKEAKTSGSYSTKNIQDKQSQGITPNQRGDGR